GGECEESESGDFAGQVRVRPEGPRREPEWVTWAIRIAGYLTLVTLGFVAHEFLWPRVSPTGRAVVRRLAQYEDILQLCEPEVRACQSRYQRILPQPPPGLSDPGPGIHIP